jgi:hypothetical protein
MAAGQDVCLLIAILGTILPGVNAIQLWKKHIIKARATVEIGSIIILENGVDVCVCQGGTERNEIDGKVQWAESYWTFRRKRLIPLLSKIVLTLF